ncbi:tetratricopeptide repeat protein [Geobacter luticola]|uniref:Tetratricopeptide repeat protein n=2 Tax=Geomobilimonas luticola TaxID=1114878 RepID=A0ABS5SEB6_9BACT|nr:tetratricopeptide repeat protein [Geomobilimonas luticola]
MNLFLLVIVCWLVYASSTTGPFIFDDDVYLMQNPAIKDLRLLADPMRLKGMNVDPDLPHNVMTRPFAYLTFAANFKLHGLDPAGFRLVNIAIHSINACLVYLLVLQLTSLARQRQEDDGHLSPEREEQLTALFVALIFAVHPVQTNAVTYIIQRFTSLAALLYLFALFAYIRARCAAVRRKKVIWYLCAMASTLLAMKTKETCFTLPLMMALVEWLFLSGPLKKRLAFLAPFALTMAVIPVTLYFITYRSADTTLKAVGQAANLVNFSQLSPLSYLFTQFTVIVTYIRIMFLPVGLNFDYDYPVYSSFFEFRVLASFGCLVLLFGTAIFLLRLADRRDRVSGASLRMAAFGIFWFFLALAVESSIIPITDVINEYRLYLPSIGIIIFAVFACEAFIRSLPDVSGQVGRRIVNALLVVVVCLLAWGTVARNRVWGDELIFWQDVVSKSPEKLRALTYLSSIYWRSNMPDQAIDTMKRITDKYPDRARAHDTLSKYYELLGRPEEAARERKMGQEIQIAMFKRQIADNPHLGQPHYFLGMLYASMGRLDEAVNEFKAAIAIRGDKPEAHYELARAYISQKKKGDAIRALDAALAIDPHNGAVKSLRSTLVAP